MRSHSCWIASRCKLKSPPTNTGNVANEENSDPRERPTAERLLMQHPFCELQEDYNFFDTDLYTKIRGTYS